MFWDFLGFMQVSSHLHVTLVMEAFYVHFINKFALVKLCVTSFSKYLSTCARPHNKMDVTGTLSSGKCQANIPCAPCQTPLWFLSIVERKEFLVFPFPGEYTGEAVLHLRSRLYR